MPRIISRLRLNSPRVWMGVFIAFIGLFVASFWVSPLDVAAPSLELLALGNEGRFVSIIDLGFAQADSAPPRATGAPRLPLVLAVHNTGRRTESASRIDISVPSWLRLYDAAGFQIHGTQETGSPLVHYRLRPPPDPIPPGGTPVVLPGYEVTGIEVAPHQFACVPDEDGLPDFIRAPVYDPVLLSRIQIYYAIAEDTLGPRATGLLTLLLDPTLARVDTAVRVPRFPVVPRDSTAPPDTTAFIRLGAREADCGQVDRPRLLHTTSFETPSGARVFALRFNGELRSFLYDIENDGRIDAAIRDADGNGTFESGRRMQLPVPRFLLPVREPTEPPDSVPPAAPDPVTRDTTAQDTAGQDTLGQGRGVW